MAEEEVAPEAPETTEAPVEEAPDYQAMLADRDTAQADLEAKLARALSGSQQSERKALEASKRAQDLESKYKDADARMADLDAYRADPTKLWADGHLTREQLDDLNRRMLKGDLNASTSADKAAAQAQAEAERVRDELAALKQERDAEKASAGFKQDVSLVQDMISAEQGGYPLLATFDRASAVVQHIHGAAKESGEAPTRESVAAVLKMAEGTLRSDLIKALASEAGLSAALADDETKARIVKALEPAAGDVATEEEPAPVAATAEADGPSTLTPEQVAETGSRKRGRQTSEDEAREAAISIMRKSNQARRDRRGTA